MKAILVLHGPNLNLLGTRQPEVYGRLTLEEIDRRLVRAGEKMGLEVQNFQSNSEGGLIDALHEARLWAGGVVFNPGGYTHTSVALRDAVSAIGIPVVEVHLSNIYARDEFRQHSWSRQFVGQISGFGWRSTSGAASISGDRKPADEGSAFLLVRLRIRSLAAAPPGSGDPRCSIAAGDPARPPTQTDHGSFFQPPDRL
jgi:3-dehydroquinate dehydratase-2